MIKGSCLCGDVKFEIRGSKGPFELCHCNRCRKATGSAFAAGLRVRGEDLRIVQGQELIKTFKAPIIDAPPPYTNRFCGRCGSPVPVPSDDASWFEVPAGALDDDPKIRPDKHIYIDFKSPWYSVSDGLPQMTKSQIQASRRAVVSGKEIPFRPLSTRAAGRERQLQAIDAHGRQEPDGVRMRARRTARSASTDR